MIGVQADPGADPADAKHMPRLSPGSRSRGRSRLVPDRHEAAARWLADPHPSARRQHTATAVAVIVGPVIETRPDTGEEEAPPEPEVPKPVAAEMAKTAMIEMREVAADESVADEGMAGESVAAKSTMTAKSTMAPCQSRRHHQRRDRHRHRRGRLRLS